MKYKTLSIAFETKKKKTTKGVIVIIFFTEDLIFLVWYLHCVHVLTLNSTVS